ncbi:ATP-binding cassette domain-containing protein [Paenibacillus sp. LMG 31456]|uniref:ATP-binding cassette domain-containing protein n=1 Tax=Paenibacillus foliorum TaxID=2654974 RepID=A0A972GTR5_9BACL|nr:ABC transporter ATP-binding protein [Paenibacillus foliorum]NOU92595.1 ATP-binding cassette domain-containing protein [Paenibacillus foliorum]
MIIMDRVIKTFLLNGKSLPILDVPHWEIEQGQRVAIIGPSGSGKSTLLHLLSGILKPDSGSISVDHKLLHELSEAARDQYRAEKIGYIFQDFHLIPSLSAEQNIELVLPTHIPKADRKRRVHEWLEKVAMLDRKDHRPAQLSRGQQQRIAIVRALINKPSLILADEPTGSLDFETASQIMSLLIDLCDAEGSTLVAVTHDLHLSELFQKTIHINEINSLVKRDISKNITNEIKAG